MRFASGASNEVFKALGKSGGFVGAGMGVGRGKGKRHRFNVAGMPAPPKPAMPAPAAAVAPKIPSHGAPDEGTLMDNLGRAKTAMPDDMGDINQNAVDPGVLDNAPTQNGSSQISADLSDSAMSELRKMNPKKGFGKGKK